MSRYASAKLCGLCGRWGTSGYREADSSERPGYNPVRDGQWVCSNDRACKRRQRPATVRVSAADLADALDRVWAMGWIRMEKDTDEIAEALMSALKPA